MLKMLIKESINLFRFFNCTIVFTKSILQLATLSECFKLTHISDSLIFNPNQNC